MNIGYLIYQAERPRTAAERRADAVRAGELAKAVSRVLPRRRHATATSLAGPASAAPGARPTLTLVRDSAASAAIHAQAPCTCEARTAS